MSGSIIIRGAREHNLKNLDVEIPRDSLPLVLLEKRSRGGRDPG